MGIGRSFQAAPLLMGLALLAAPMTAQARSGESPDDWKIVEAGGCNLLINAQSFDMFAGFVAPEGFQFRSVTWKGGCDANGLATGPGHAIVAITDPFGKSSESDYRGTTRNGAFEGRVAIWRLVPEGPGGSYIVDQSGLDDSGDTYYKYVFTRGCRDMDFCTSPAGGDTVLQAYLRKRAEDDRAPVTAATGAASTGGASSGGSSGGGGGGRGFQNSCVSVRAPEGDRAPGAWAANDWALVNSCDVKLYVTWCARPSDVTAGLNNMCTDRKFVTNELPAMGTILFQTVSDSVAVDLYACRAPNFPQDAAFGDDGRLTATRCP